LKLIHETGVKAQTLNRAAGPRRFTIDFAAGGQHARSCLARLAAEAARVEQVNAHSALRQPPGDRSADNTCTDNHHVRLESHYSMLASYFKIPRMLL
jgi:hypothetical protein